MRIVFFGTSAFAAQILSFLFQHSLNIVSVVTQPDRPKGRHLHSSYSPVKECVLALHPSLPLLQPEKISTGENQAILQSLNPDIFLVVAYGEILKKTLLDTPRIGSFNIHASLLPKYRGAAPIQRCLMDGESKTGITIIEMTPQMDAGDILATAEVVIPKEMNFGELEKALCDAACSLSLKFIRQLIKAENIPRTPQDSSRATFAPKLQSDDMRLRWDAPASSLHNFVRAFSPHPGAWCPIYFGKEQKRIKIKRAVEVQIAHHSSPGTILVSNQKNELLIACQQGALGLLEVQLEGKKAMSVEDFLKGLQHPFSFNPS